MHPLGNSNRRGGNISGNTVRRTLLAALAWPLLCAAPLAPAWAQQFPARTVTLVCPFPPGGSTDIMARLVAQKLTEGLGATVIVENKPGAGGAVTAAFVAKARPDGHTLLLVTGAYPAQAALTLTPQFDALRDIAMVSTVTSYRRSLSVSRTHGSQRYPNSDVES